MSVLWFGQSPSTGTDADSNAVRSTYQKVQADAPAAEMPDAPEFNEVEYDSNPDVGLGPRQLASDWHDSDRVTFQDTSRVDLDIVNDQVATSGRAAAKEAAGEWGRGTMGYAVGIEPTIRDGAAFGADYFAANKPDGYNSLSTQDTGIQAQDVNPDDLKGVTAYGKDATRDAARSAYDAFLGRS